MQPGRERRLVTAALVLGIFLAALEATAVATAMPTVVGELGGVERYSWVFSAYLLASTTTVPMYGKLADLHGRRLVYTASVILFLVGSALSGLARSIEQLIAFRALQGLGAGGLMPVAITLVGDIYDLEERGRMQGLFSGIWGVASLVGPAAGGLVTDLLSWRWVFYLNVPFGLASALLLNAFLRESLERRGRRLDVLGTLLLTGSLLSLLVALLEGGSALGWSHPATVGLLLAAGAGGALFVWQERRAAEPVLPLDLFRSRLVAVASLGSVMIGTLLFSAVAFVPMFAQGVLGGTAAAAGATLAPMSIGWPVASTLAGRWILRVGYRRLASGGGLLAVLGTGMLALAGAGSSRLHIMAAMLVLGAGLGFMATPYLLAVQNSVPWGRRGVATSAIQFSRTIGGAIAVAAFGAVLNAALGAGTGGELDANAALEPGLRARLDPASLALLVSALAEGLSRVHLALVGVAAVAFAIAVTFPGGSAASHAHATERRPGPSGEAHGPGGPPATAPRSPER